MEIVRRELIDRVVQGGRVVAVIGPAGAGKSSLAAQVGDVVGLSVVNAPLAPLRTGPDEMRLLLLRGLREAEVPVDRGDDPFEILDRLPDPVLVVIDDVHHMSDVDAEAAAGPVGQLATKHRVLLVGRRLPGELGRVVDETIGDTDLTLRATELVALAGPAAPEAEGVLDAVHRAAAGLIGPSALFLHALAEHRMRPDQLASPTGTVAAALAESLAALTRERRELVGELARFRLLVDGLDRAIGATGLLVELRQVGIPVQQIGHGRWHLPDWVRDRIAHPGPLDPAIAAAASTFYRSVGEVYEAVAVLLDAGSADAAADGLGNMTPGELDGLDLHDVDPLIVRMPGPTLAAHPEVRLLQARLSADAVLMSRRAAILDDLLADESLPPVLRRRVLAEQARDLVRDGRAERADALAVELLDAASSDELWTRTIALEVRGRAVAYGASTMEALDLAERHLDAALAVADRLHSADMRSMILGFAGYSVDVPAGRLGRGVQRMREAADLIAGRPRRRAVLLTAIAEVEHLRGEMALAAQAADDAAIVADRLGDHRLQAYVAWERARSAGLQGHSAELAAQVAEVERHAAEWFVHPTGMLFLADMADLHDRVGDHVTARRYAERSLARMAELGPDDPDPLMSALALEARRGDPDQALAFADRIDATGQLAPLRAWRVHLLRALAIDRAGRGGAGELAAAAIDDADRLGVLHMVPLLEPEGLAALRHLAALAGSVAAARLAEVPAKVEVRVLGGFVVTRGGRPVQLPAGQPVQLVKYLATREGRAHVERIIDALWPDADVAGGRKLLRNVLTRLNRGMEEPLVEREGDTLTFADGTVVDALSFTAHARRALDSGDTPAATVHGRLAAAAFTGDLLPDDLYEDWADEPRRVLRGQAVAILRKLARRAANDGDVDAAVRHVERAIEIDPLDEDHHLTLHRVLADAGRRAAADRALARWAVVLDS